MRVAIVILVCLLGLIQYKLWFGRGSFSDLLELKEAIAVVKEENQTLLERNKALEAEIRDLREGYASIEERARLQLGMVREGETFYQIVDNSAMTH